MIMVTENAVLLEDKALGHSVSAQVNISAGNDNPTITRVDGAPHFKEPHTKKAKHQTNKSS